MVNKSKFEELVGDVEAFRLMLEGAFKEWMGAYNVLLVDTNEYLFPKAKEHKYFRPFCRKLRSKDAGENRCRECNRNAAFRAAQERRPLAYPCHAGLIDIAIPILVNEKLVATVFCGQIRPKSKELNEEGLRKAQQLERKLGFEAGELVSLWWKVPQISDDEINNVINKVWKIVTYVSELGHEKLELQKRFWKDKQRLKESKSLEWAARELGGLVGEWDEFWSKVDKVLEQMTKVIGASCVMMLIPETGDFTERRFMVKAVAQLPTKKFKGRLYSYNDELFQDKLLQKVIEKGEITLVPFIRDHQNSESICGSMMRFAPSLAAKIDEVALTRVRLGEGVNGILLFFLNKKRDISESLPIDEEKITLAQLASLIGTAYHNCSLYQARQRDIILRRDWLRRVTHQLLAPLHGLQGYAEDAWERLVRWEKEGPQYLSDWTPDKIQKWKNELQRWKHSFEAVVWSSHYAARLARNLSWIIFGADEKTEFDLVEDAVGLLIKCARDFQGIARERGLRRVKVDAQSIAPLNGKLYLNDDLLRQAIGNLLDNAVKYSYRNTDIVIEGSIAGRWAQVRVINVGVCLHQDEIEKIFEEGYRGEEARRRHPAGTGIGLTVARQIIELHGGKLTARPSVQTRYGCKTTFTIWLPIQTKK